MWCEETSREQLEYFSYKIIKFPREKCRRKLLFLGIFLSSFFVFSLSILVAHLHYLPNSKKNKRKIILEVNSFSFRLRIFIKSESFPRSVLEMESFLCLELPQTTSIGCVGKLYIRKNGKFSQREKRVKVNVKN